MGREQDTLAGVSTSAAADAKPVRFTWKQRLQLALISGLGRLLISLIGRTLRYEVSSEPDGVKAGEYPPDFVIGPFWHRCVIPATWYFRKRGIAVITSQSYDGEYIARIIESF